ncbi:MAG: rhomboid family intramembrane serine protease [Planctomycetota bacterium]|nr:rhomboid family intramembrane serine protease [Planctomycetota bacterium]
MFFPYADEPPREGRFPWMNWLLIAANVLVFLWLSPQSDYEQTVLRYGFVPLGFRPITLLTATFLHANLMHLLGNMWFLHLFGDNVENRCGPWKYLLVYLVCGVAGDAGQYLFFPESRIPSIGASGAIFGVLGMYLFFFPANRIRVFYFFFILVGRVAVRAIWVIGLWFGMELLYSHIQTATGMESGVGHLAHSGGFIAGVALATLFTALGLVPFYGDDLVALLSGKAPRREPVPPPDHTGGPAPVTPAPDAVADPRNEIVALLHAGRTDEARRAWRRFAFDNHADALPVREQLEVALALDKNGQRGAAREAYERLLAAYPNEQPFAAEASLALAGMLLQALKESGDAHEVPLIEDLLRRVVESHPYEARRALARKWLEAVRQ